ncbi:MAG: sigma-54-dependent Fis family transcriptional regulator [Lentisphaerales bacterium]|nr:MAG: sigma-54-dependent Fis family transcriptional regulator [Lentisphaerales bacterium]
MSNPRVLIVEDDPDGLRSVSEAVRDAGFEAVAVTNGTDAVSAFRQGHFDAVLSDLVLPDIDGIEVLVRIRKINRETPVLIMTAYGSIQSAVQALKSGAYDYVLKPLDLDDIQSKVAAAVKVGRLRSESSKTLSASSMVGTSARMKEVFTQILSLADNDATVLVVGESGTGKELVAQALHADGRRHAGPFVAVNCGAFAESLLESELFGHEKGAFTGATSLRKGAFERADGGTLFLDEISNAPQSVQVKLLRVLERRELTRVGGQQSIKVDARIISATNRELGERVKDGGFRQDLLYRLKVITIRTPPLRERMEDVRALADSFVARACEEHGRSVSEIDPSYYAALERHNWPGNVRELRNVVEASVVLATSPVLSAGDVRIEDLDAPDGEPSVKTDLTLARMEKDALLQALRKCNGNRTATAERLGLSRRTIQRKIKEYNLPF